MDKTKIVGLIKIIESNNKLLNSYKRIINKIESLEEELSKKFKNKEEENKFMDQIIESSTDYYYLISQNCL